MIEEESIARVYVRAWCMVHVVCVRVCVACVCLYACIYIKCVCPFMLRVRVIVANDTRMKDMSNNNTRIRTNEHTNKGKTIVKLTIISVLIN